MCNRCVEHSCRENGEELQALLARVMLHEGSVHPIMTIVTQFLEP